MIFNFLFCGNYSINCDSVIGVLVVDFLEFEVVVDFLFIWMYILIVVLFGCDEVINVYVYFLS